MNSIVLIGRLVRDPEVRYTSNTQMAVATFTIAVDRPVKAGEERKADFPRITVLGRQAENCEKYISKGSRIAVQGRIQTGQYKDKDGKTVYTTDVMANRIEFLEYGQRQAQGDSNSIQQENSYSPAGFYEDSGDIPF